MASISTSQTLEFRPPAGGITAAQAAEYDQLFKLSQAEYDKLKTDKSKEQPHEL